MMTVILIMMIPRESLTPTRNSAKVLSLFLQHHPIKLKKKKWKFDQIGILLSFLLCIATGAWVAHYTSADLRSLSHIVLDLKLLQVIFFIPLEVIILYVTIIQVA